MRKIFLLTVLLSLASCAPTNGPHKPVDEEQGGNNGEFSTVGYDSVGRFSLSIAPLAIPRAAAPIGSTTIRRARSRATENWRGEWEASAPMPPPGSPQAASISDSERLALVAWAKSGGRRESQAAQAQNNPPAPELNAQEKLVQKCLHCHGSHGPDPSAEPRIPLLAGQNQKYLELQLHRFKWLDRLDPSQTMNQIAIDLSDQQIRETSEYFAVRGVPASAPAGSGEPAINSLDRKNFQLGKKISEDRCDSCHRNREYGNRPTNELLPSLNGQSKTYLINQLLYFRSGRRSNPLMREFARELSNSDIEALATYFANVH